MQFTLSILAADPPTPDSAGHDLTWPYWVGVGVAAVLVILIPMIWGRARAGGVRAKRVKRVKRVKQGYE